MLQQQFLAWAGVPKLLSPLRVGWGVEKWDAPELGLLTVAGCWGHAPEGRVLTAVVCLQSKDMGCGGGLMVRL